MTYNGYANWETWAVALHFDELLYEMALEYVRRGKAYSQYLKDAEDEIVELTLRELHHPNQHTMASEFVCASLHMVDYNHLCEDAWVEATRTFKDE